MGSEDLEFKRKFQIEIQILNQRPSKKMEKLVNSNMSQGMALGLVFTLKKKQEKRRDVLPYIIKD